MKQIGTLILIIWISINSFCQTWSRYYNITSDAESVDLFVPYKEGYLIGSNVFCSPTLWDGCTYLMYIDKNGDKIKDNKLSLGIDSSILIWPFNNISLRGNNEIKLFGTIEHKTGVFQLDSNLNLQNHFLYDNQSYLFNSKDLFQIDSNRYIYFQQTVNKIPTKYENKLWMILTDSNFIEIKQYGLINENKFYQIGIPHVEKLFDKSFIVSFRGKFYGEGNDIPKHFSLIRFDSIGNILWTKVIDQPLTDNLDTSPVIKQLNNGNIVTAGATNFLKGSLDYFPNFLQFVSIYGDSINRVYFDYATCKCVKRILNIQIAPNGDIIGSGYAASVDALFYKAWIFRISQDGIMKWERFYTFENKDIDVSFPLIYVDSDNSILVGSNASKDKMNGLWALKLDSMGCLTPDCSGTDLITSVKEVKEGYKELKEVFFSVSPNPIEQLININYFSPQPGSEVKFILSDRTGINIHEIKSVDLGGLYKMEVEDLKSGSYFVSMLLNGRVVQTEKIVKN